MNKKQDINTNKTDLIINNWTLLFPYYIKSNPDLEKIIQNQHYGLKHYLKFGIKEHRSFGFDVTLENINKLKLKQKPYNIVQKKNISDDDFVNSLSMSMFNRTDTISKNDTFNKIDTIESIDIRKNSYYFPDESSKKNMEDSTINSSVISTICNIVTNNILSALNKTEENTTINEKSNLENSDNEFSPIITHEDKNNNNNDNYADSSNIINFNNFINSGKEYDTLNNNTDIMDMLLNIQSSNNITVSKQNNPDNEKIIQNNKTGDLIDLNFNYDNVKVLDNNDLLNCSVSNVLTLNNNIFDDINNYSTLPPASEVKINYTNTEKSNINNYSSLPPASEIKINNYATLPPASEVKINYTNTEKSNYVLASEMNSYDVNYLLNQLNNSVKPVTEQNHMIFHKPNTMSINEQKISTIFKPVTEKEVDSLFKQKTENDTINTIFRPNTEKEADSVFKSITEQKILTEKKQIKQNKNNNHFTEQKTVTEKKQIKQNKYNDFFSEQSDTLVKNKNTDTSKSEKTLINSLNRSIFEPKKKQIEKLLKNNKNLIESINKDLATESKNDDNNNNNNVNSFNNIITEIKKNDSNFNDKIIDNYKS